MANIYNSQTYLTMKRSSFDRAVPHKTSVPFGKVVPVGTYQDVLPADTWKLTLSNVTRMLTPTAPIMDDISMDIYGFFIPWRLIFDKTKNFFGENDLVAWTLVQNIEIPHLKLMLSDGTATVNAYTDDPDDFYSKSNTTRYLYLVDDATTPTMVLDSIFAGSLFDYFALPFVYPNLDLLDKIKTLIGTAVPGQKLFLESIDALPFRAVQLTYNEFFRNENVTDPILELNYDQYDHELFLYTFSFAYAHHKANDNSFTALDMRFWFVPSAARWKDLFTSCLPAPQRGPSVALPLSQNTAPVVAGGVTAWHSAGNAIRIGSDNIVAGASGAYYGLNSYLAGTNDSDADKNKRGQLGVDRTSTSRYVSDIANYTNLQTDLSSVTMATINQLRYAFATQRYYEKLARGGSRYTEYLQVMFGVKNSDAVLQRPQFLGGHHQRINVQQVLQTSQTDNTPLGSTGAYSVTGFKNETYVNSFGEFGLVLNFAVIRKEHTYCQGLDVKWTKRDVFDLYNPTFAMIGEVPVMRNEVYWLPGDKNVLGYNESWYQYRSESAKVSGLLNPLAPANLSSFVLTDVYESAPALTDEFIFEDKQGLDRALVAKANVTDQFLCDFYFDYKVSRVMPIRSIPGLIDHF